MGSTSSPSACATTRPNGPNRSPGCRPRRFAPPRGCGCEAQPGALEWGCAIEHTPNTIQTVRAISMLPALTGNIDKPGGWCFGMRALAPFPFLPEVLPEEQKAKRLGAAEFRVLGGAGSLVPSAHMPSVFKSMREGDPYWTKGFLVFGNNALSTYADSRLVHESLTKLDFLMVADLFMTPTCELADVVLPVAAWPELDQIVAMPYFGEDVVLAQQHGEQVGECRQDEVIMTELARRLGLPHCDESPRDIFNQQLAPLGMTYDELAEHGPVKIPMKYGKFVDKGFATPTGKIELYSTRLRRAGLRSAALLRGAAGEPAEHARDREGLPLRAHHRRAHADVLSFRRPADSQAAPGSSRAAGGDSPGRREKARHHAGRLGA